MKVTPTHNEECKKLLGLMGIPFIDVSVLVGVYREIDVCFLSVAK